MEEKSRESILDFYEKKNHTIHDSIIAERNKYKDKKSTKDREIAKIAELEMHMIKNHS